MKKFITHNIEVMIYSNKASMRRAITAIGYKCDKTESMVIPVKVYDFSNNGRKKLQPLVAEMYLHKKISLPVLVHETVHAATTLLRRDKQKPNLSTKIGYTEELFAYTQTAILQDILKVFFPKRNSDYNFDNIKKWARGSRKQNTE